MCLCRKRTSIERKHALSYSIKLLQLVTIYLAIRMMNVTISIELVAVMIR